ncbi:MAG: AAA family ATPase [Cyanobacteria bacterium P01_A01_bin.45]
MVVSWNVIVLGITTANVVLTPRVWESQAQLILPKVTSNLDADFGKLGNLKDNGVVFSQQLNPLNILSSIALSDKVLKKVWEKDPQKARYQNVSSYKKLFAVTPESESTVISLTVSGSSPQIAQERAKKLIEAFQKRLQELRKDEASARSQFLQKEVNLAYQKLLKAQGNLSKFKQSSRLVKDEEQTNETVKVINNLENQRVGAIAEAKAAEVKTRMLSARLNLPPQAAIKSTRLEENKEYQLYRDNLAKVELELKQAESKLTEDHPQIKDLRYQKNVLSTQMQKYISKTSKNVKGVDAAVGSNSSNLIEELILSESQAAAMFQKSEQLQMQITKMRYQLSKLPEKQAKLQELQRKYNISEGVYNGLVAQIEQAKLGAFSAYPSIQVLDEPVLETSPSSPKLRLMALGAILAAILGSAAIILFKESRNPLLSPRDIQHSDIPVLASISHTKDLIAKIDQEIAGDLDFQRLASAVSLMDLENKSLMVTSATSSEGKTTITMGFARALVNLGFKVLCVDGDFRKQKLSQTLGYQVQREVIETPTEIDAPTDKSLTTKARTINVLPGLDLLSIHLTEDRIAEFIARGEFEQLLNFTQTVGGYDYILIDSSPVTMTSEAGLIAACVRNILFVARSGYSDRNSFQDSLEHLNRHQAQILGLVINSVESRNEGYIYGQLPLRRVEE